MTASSFTPTMLWGHVGDTFSTGPVISRLQGDAAIGHVRYSTTGDTIFAQCAAAVRQF